MGPSSTSAASSATSEIGCTRSGWNFSTAKAPLLPTRRKERLAGRTVLFLLDESGPARP
ncbi:MAG: hypothetical protein U0168_09025 [Nannocystaceae bacterium]